MSTENHLKARVKARNQANEGAVRLYDTLVDIFRPLVGQKILKQGGGLLAKHAAMLPEFPCDRALHIYKHSSAYSLMWCVNVCESIEDGHGCVYEEACAYIGHLDCRTLTKLYEAPDLPADFTVEDILAKRDVFKLAKAAADEAHSALFPFGEHDR